MNNGEIPELRTIRQLAKETNIPEHLIRSLVKQNQIRYVMAGNRAYIVKQSLFDFLTGECEARG